LGKTLWSKFRVATGFLMIALGIIGLFVPLMPTVPFLFAAVAMLGRDHPAVRPFTSRLDRWRNSRRSGQAKKQR
jgi:uncharacterized membrane protein YbaN (DUF454 family)